MGRGIRVTETWEPRMQALGGQAGRRCGGWRNVARLGAHVGAMWEDNAPGSWPPSGGSV